MDIRLSTFILNRVIWSGYKRYGSTIERGSDRLGGSRSSRERKANTEGSPQAGWNLIFSKKAVDKWRLLSRPRSFLGQWYKMATVLRYLVHRTWIKDRERSIYIRHERCPVRASIDPWPRQSSRDNLVQISLVITKLTKLSFFKWILLGFSYRSYKY